MNTAITINITASEAHLPVPRDITQGNTQGSSDEMLPSKNESRKDKRVSKLNYSTSK